MSHPLPLILPPSSPETVSVPILTHNRGRGRPRGRRSGQTRGLARGCTNVLPQSNVNPVRGGGNVNAPCTRGGRTRGGRTRGARGGPNCWFIDWCDNIFPLVARLVSFSLPFKVE